MLTCQKGSDFYMGPKATESSIFKCTIEFLKLKKRQIYFQKAHSEIIIPVCRES